MRTRNDELLDQVRKEAESKDEAFNVLEFVVQWADHMEIELDSIQRTIQRRLARGDTDVPPGVPLGQYLDRRMVTLAQITEQNMGGIPPELLKAVLQVMADCWVHGEEFLLAWNRHISRTEEAMKRKVIEITRHLWEQGKQAADRLESNLNAPGARITNPQEWQILQAALDAYKKGLHKPVTPEVMQATKAQQEAFDDIFGE